MTGFHYLKVARTLAFGMALAGVASPVLADDATIRADNCSIAGGHDANGNIITCNFGLTPEQLKQLTEAAVAGATGPLVDRIVTLSKRLGITEEATKTLLKIVGEQPNVPDEDLPKALTKVAMDYKRREAQVAAISTESPLARALVTQAKTEITAGHLEKAGDLLQKSPSEWRL